MDNPSNQSDLDQLLARLVDGEATGDDIAALEKLLDGNADAQRRYVHYVDLHTELLSRSDVARSILSSVGTDDSGRAAIPDRPTTKLVMVAALAGRPFDRHWIRGLATGWLNRLAMAATLVRAWTSLSPAR